MMLKEVGSSGQISLGKKYAGRLYEVTFHPDGRVEMSPMKVVSAAPAPAPKSVRSPDGWRPPGGYDRCTQWALDNREALEAYAERIERDGTAAEQLRLYLAGEPDSAGR